MQFTLQKIVLPAFSFANFDQSTIQSILIIFVYLFSIDLPSPDCLPSFDGFQFSDLSWTTHCKHNSLSQATFFDPHCYVYSPRACAEWMGESLTLGDNMKIAMKSWNIWTCNYKVLPMKYQLFSYMFDIYDSQQDESGLY